MTSSNEWGKLKKVIVGVADHAVIPPMDRSMRYINYADREDVTSVPNGAYPQQVIEEANEDLETLCEFLRGEGVEVLRPKREPTKFYNYCPRDCIFIHDDLALATPMPLQARKDNWRSIEHHIKVKTAFYAKCTYDDQLYNEECIGNKDILALSEHSPAFDAANVIRANNDLLYLVSNSGNVKGAELLQSMVKPDVKVHLLKDVYSYMHIDSTVAFLREGLLMVNPSRVKKKEDLPEPFCHWDIIYCNEPEDQGYFGEHNYASPWVWNMNLLSVNENLVILEEHQNTTRKLLESWGIECAMLPMRHGRTLAGGFHCVTLDLDRE